MTLEGEVHADRSSALRRRWVGRGADLDTDRVRARVSAYVYGNILTLAAVLGVDAESIEAGWALLTVLVTMSTTYLAHVLAHDIGQRLGRSPEEFHRHMRAELRDALPILTSGALPMVPLALAALTSWGPTTAQLVAAGTIVVRLAGTGWVVARVDRQRAPRFAWWSGAVLAGTGSVIAVLKVTLLH